jgi:RNA polymerase sigma-70 factor, ECF subfamily
VSTGATITRILNLPRWGLRRGTLTTEKAFSHLYETTHRSVYRYLYGLVGGAVQDAEDLTAETFLKAWNAREQFEGDDDAALGWLLTIAKRLVIDAARRQQSRPVSVDIAEDILSAPDATPEEQAIFTEQSQQLWALVQSLPDDKREMVILRYLLGWRVNRIAAHLNLPENTVSVSLKRIITQLRDTLNMEDAQ